jgi:hypothetical protein
MSSNNAVLSLPSMANPANITSEADTAPFQPSPVEPVGGFWRGRIGKDPASGASGVYGAYRAV